MSVKERILLVFEKYGIGTASEIAEHNSPIYTKLWRQVFSDSVKEPNIDVINFVLAKFPDISAEWLLRGNGDMYLSNIEVPVQHHHQEIHSDGAPIAVTQNGDARVCENSCAKFTSADIARMINENDLGSLVAIILAQKDEIIYMQNERIEELRRTRDK